MVDVACADPAATSSVGAVPAGTASEVGSGNARQGHSGHPRRLVGSGSVIFCNDIGGRISLRRGAPFVLNVFGHSQVAVFRGNWEALSNGNVDVQHAHGLMHAIMRRANLGFDFSGDRGFGGEHVHVHSGQQLVDLVAQILGKRSFNRACAGTAGVGAPISTISCGG